MIQSMTGYANAEKTESDLSVSIEIKSYNSRYLDLALRIPQQHAWLEDTIRNIISKRLSRGRIEISLKTDDNSDQTFSFQINESKADSLSNAVLILKDRFNINVQIPFEFLSGAGSVIKPVQTKKEPEFCMRVVKDCLNEALTALIDMRIKEGTFIAEDILKHLGVIEKQVEQLEELSGNLLPYYHKRLKDRIHVLTQGQIQIEPERIAQEAALLADKSDISEEIIRVKSHIEHFHQIMNSGESVGRKLNFLLQEFNREFNTIGSKTGKTDISYLIVEAKSELEKIREQVQNVE